MKKIQSYCKINLSLRVLRKLNSGYHNIQSLITFCNISDIIHINQISDKKDKILFSGRFKKNINLKSNTITKLLKILRKKNFLRKRKFEIRVQKNIPHGSGLGGGSSNAASLLSYFNSFFKLKLTNKKIYQLASKVGNDVPVCILRKNSLITGKGGQILRLNNRFKLNILIVYPDIVCLTKKIYLRNKTYSNAKRFNITQFKHKKLLIDILKNEKNDLQNTVIKNYPKIGQILTFILNMKGCYLSRITGSGSACIGIFDTKRKADIALKIIKKKFPRYWCVASKTI